MKKSIKVAPKKRRGRPATGKDPHIAARMPQDLIAQIEAWAAANDTSRSEAFRTLVELGLDTIKPPAQTTAKTADKAKELAGDAINHMADKFASADEKASRKRRLISGPEEFRDVRVDRPKEK
jgi:Arc/MetJ-type ribon-helix-helix transcriptional regulator